MGQAKDRRQRAVRLTDEGLGILRARLDEECGRSGDGRLTRAARAAILEVSIGTVERMLGQRGNDRAVLVQAFERLGIPWDQRYCELRITEADEEPDPIAEVEPQPPVPVRRQTWPKFAFASAIAATTVALFMIVALKSSPPLVTDPHEPVSQALDIGRRAYHRADYVQATEYVQFAYTLARKNSLADQMAFCLSLQGDILAAQGDLKGAVESYKKALTFWGELQNAHGRASLLDSLGAAEARLGLLEDAEEHFQEGLKTCKNVTDPGVIGGILRGLGSTEAVRGNFASAKKWYDAAVVAITDRDQGPMLLDIKALRALVLRDEGDFDEAKRELQACLSAWREVSQERWIAATLLQIGSVHAKMGRMVEARQDIGEARGLYKSVGDQRGTQLCTQWLDGDGSNVDAAAWRVEEFF